MNRLSIAAALAVSFTAAVALTSCLATGARAGEVSAIEAEFLGYDDAAYSSDVCRHLKLDMTDHAALARELPAIAADKKLTAAYEKGRKLFHDRLLRNGVIACGPAGASEPYSSIVTD